MLRLSFAFLFIALLSSRIALFLHEFVGHGALAIALGGEVDGYRLFLFGGGRVGYANTDSWGAIERHLVSLGGILVELVSATAVLILARRREGLWRLFGACFGTVVLIHAGSYLASGVHHGYGDGRYLHSLLDESRPALVVPLVVVLITGSYFLARALATELRGWQPELPAHRALLRVGGAVLMAGSIHAGLAQGELWLAGDLTLEGIMRSQSDRAIERDLDAYLAAFRAVEGRAPTADELAAQVRRLADIHWQFPLKPLLGLGIALAGLVGAWRSRPPISHAPLLPLLRLGLACAAILIVTLFFRSGSTG